MRIDIHIENSFSLTNSLNRFNILAWKYMLEAKTILDRSTEKISNNSQQVSIRNTFIFDGFTVVKEIVAFFDRVLDRVLVVFEIN